MIKDEKGLSLIELVITIAIIAIFSATVLAVISTTSTMMKTTSTVATIQNVSQETADQLKEFIMETNESIYYGYGTFDHPGEAVENGSDLAASGDREKSLYLQKKQGGTSYIETITWNPTDQQLLYKKNGVSGGTSTSQMEILASNVSDFRVDISNVESKQYVQVYITIQKNERSNTVRQTISLRNKVKIQSPF